MSHAWTANLFRKMPAKPNTVLNQFFFSMMSPDMLQVGYDTLDLSMLRHRVDEIIQHSHFAPGKQARRLSSPGLSSIPYIERYCVSPATEGSRTEIGVPPPFELGIKPVQLLQIKIKMRQPGWDFSGICGNGNLTPKNLKIDIRTDLGDKVTPNNRVRIEPDVVFKRPLPHGGQFCLVISAHQGAHFVRPQFRNPQDEQIVFAFQIRNIKCSIHNQANWNRRTVIPHAGQRRLNHELVSRMAARHKTEWRLRCHIIRADCLRYGFTRLKTTIQDC